ncbi:OsmC family protein [Dinoroseobacter sp. S375]|uniref:OsmC family protein n=1 Tax=Dinoroseobacter sp. S375 TaxID=3415136 RepID=UPI003C7ED73E
MALRPKPTVTLKADAQCPSHSRADVTIRDLAFAIDEPTERGGTNAGPTPTDTALGALIGCTNVIGHKCATRLGVDIGHLAISVTCRFDRRGVTLAEEIDVPFEAITQTVLSDGTATDQELQTVAREVEKFCPLAKLFAGAGTELTTIWRKA